MQDANGTYTDLTYHPRGWLLTRTVRANSDGSVNASADAKTTFEYDNNVGNVARITQPDGVYLSYNYDAAHRLNEITDSLGNTIHYTLDVAGNRTEESTKDLSGTLLRSLSRNYNNLGRLTAILNASSATVRNFANPADDPPAGVSYRGSRVPTSGGAYGFIETAFGPLAAYVAGTMLWLAGLLASGSVAAALADMSVPMLPYAWRTVAHAAIIIFAIGIVAVINMGGATKGAGLIKVAVAIKLIPLVLFLFVGTASMQVENFHSTATPDSGDIGRALILALAMLTGMEAPLCASGEVTQPTRTIPRALLVAMLTIVILFIASQLTAQGILGGALATSSAPLADAAARVNPALRWMLLGSAAVSMFGALASDIFGTPRVLFAFARDGRVPAVLGRIHGHTHTPHVAIAVYASAAMLLALTGTFAELAVLSALASCVLYIGGCAAAWLLALRNVAFTGSPLNFRGLGLAAAISIASMLMLIALAQREEIIGLVATMSASALAFMVQTRILGINYKREESR